MDALLDVFFYLLFLALLLLLLFFLLRVLSILERIAASLVMFVTLTKLHQCRTEPQIPSSPDPPPHDFKIEKARQFNEVFDGVLKRNRRTSGWAGWRRLQSKGKLRRVLLQGDRLRARKLQLRSSPLGSKYGASTSLIATSTGRQEAFVASRETSRFL